MREKHERKSVKTPALRLSTLTQPTLVKFEWFGHFWEEAIMTLPVSTLNNLTDLDILEKSRSPSTPSEVLNSLESTLPRLHKLEHLAIEVNHRILTCSAMRHLIRRLPSKLRLLNLGVADWNYATLLKAIKKQEALRWFAVETSQYLWHPDFHRNRFEHEEGIDNVRIRNRTKMPTNRAAFLRSFETEAKAWKKFMWDRREELGIVEGRWG
ncbi:hypothetical protein HK097_006803 [Rhizophlyctis rosea]|uniref:Uncharacterized protein n=1 Tax=Rhizophlyctis rosea TaxID=64517 RepID=A0AAD5SEL2_9FUNG|nr:hypothetical protein HK097_006803 [Rhizophlyctis rosea]